MMKALVVYYSRTGITRKVASQLGEMLSADVEEIVDAKNRSGPLGFVVSCKDAVRQKSAKIEPVRHDPDDYDVVLVGTPVWANTMACAVRTWLGEHGPQIRNLACFCTMARSRWGSTLEDMAQEADVNPVAGAAFRQKSVKADAHRKALEDFAAAIEARVAATENQATSETQTD